MGLRTNLASDTKAPSIAMVRQFISHHSWSKFTFNLPPATSTRPNSLHPVYRKWPSYRLREKAYQSSHKNIVHSNMQMVSYVYIYSSISVCAIVLSYTCFVTVGYGKRRPPTKGSSHKGLKQDMHIMPVYLMATDFNAVMWGWYSCQEVLGLLWCIITQ